MSRSNPNHGIRSGRYSGPVAATGTLCGPAKLYRPCPACGAAAGWRCRRWISERSSATTEPGGHWVTLKTMHRQR